MQVDKDRVRTALAGGVEIRGAVAAWPAAVAAGRRLAIGAGNSHHGMAVGLEISRHGQSAARHRRTGAARSMRPSWLEVLGCAVGVGGAPARIAGLD